MIGLHDSKGSHMVVGYTAGVFDLFHVGHVRILKNAKSLCDRLIVGVSTDDLAFEAKGNRPVISFDERLEIVSSVGYVDAAVAQASKDKMDAWNRYKFDYMFVGDDWFQSDKWQDLDSRFREIGVNIVYFPYTKNISSTLVYETLERLRTES